MCNGKRMMGLREICGLLLAGGVGAGSVVAVQQAAPAVKRTAHKPVARPKAPKPVLRTATASAAPPAGMIDCAPAMPLGALGMESGPGFSAIGGKTPFSGGGYGGGGPGGGDGGLGGGPTPVPAPGVPEPASWGLMVSGFGLIGLAVRRGRKPEISRAVTPLPAAASA